MILFNTYNAAEIFAETVRFEYINVPAPTPQKSGKSGLFTMPESVTWQGIMESTMMFHSEQDILSEEYFADVQEWSDKCLELHRRAKKEHGPDREDYLCVRPLIQFRVNKGRGSGITTILLSELSQVIHTLKEWKSTLRKAMESRLVWEDHYLENPTSIPIKSEDLAPGLAYDADGNIVRCNYIRMRFNSGKGAKPLSLPISGYDEFIEKLEFVLNHPKIAEFI